MGSVFGIMRRQKTPSLLRTRRVISCITMLVVGWRRPEEESEGKGDGIGLGVREGLGMSGGNGERRALNDVMNVMYCVLERFGRNYSLMHYRRR